jgi:hypothetical protein
MEIIVIFVHNFFSKQIMATITLNYDAGNAQVQKTLEYILSMGFFSVEKKAKKTGLELAFEDIEKGRVHRLITPKNRK